MQTTKFISFFEKYLYLECIEHLYVQISLYKVTFLINKTSKFCMISKNVLMLEMN